MTRMPFFANRIEVRAARDERDVLTRRRQPPAEIPADRTCANDRDLHRVVEAGDAVDTNRARIGLSSTNAMIAATMFMTAIDR